MEYLVRNINFLLKQKRLSSGEFAKEMGWSLGKFSTYSTGRVVPKIDSVAQIAEYFEVSIDDLVYKDLETSKPVQVKRDNEKDQILIDLLFKEVIRLRAEKIAGGADESALDDELLAMIQRAQKEKK